MNVIPAIDLRGGRVVRLRQGDYAAETRYPTAPAEVARAYAAAGATWLHVVDLDAARSGAPAELDTVRAIAAAADCPVQAGGGVRRADDIERLLEAGVARVVVGSVAVREPDTVMGWIARFGAERICVALDVRAVGGDGGEYVPATAGWTESSAVGLDGLLAHYGACPPGLALLCTDIARDGMMAGPNLALYARVRTVAPSLALQASGGIRDAGDLEALRRLGVAGAIVGRALLERPEQLPEMLAC